MVRTLYVVLSVMVFTALVGCQSGGMPSASSSPPTRAVLVTGGNGGGTEVFIPSSDPSGVMVLSSSSTSPICKQCQEDISAYFATGHLDPKCSVCGATRTPLTIVPTNLGHQ